MNRLLRVFNINCLHLSYVHDVAVVFFEDVRVSIGKYILDSSLIHQLWGFNVNGSKGLINRLLPLFHNALIILFALLVDYRLMCQFLVFLIFNLLLEFFELFLLFIAFSVKPVDDLIHLLFLQYLLVRVSPNHLAAQLLSTLLLLPILNGLIQIGVVHEHA